MAKYILALKIQELKTMLSSSRVDKQNKNKLHLTGDFMQVFNNMASIHEFGEKHKVNLKKTNAVAYVKRDRSNTPLLRINSNCVLCSSNCKYTITIEHYQVDEKLNAISGREFVDVQFVRQNEHVHESVTVKLTGEKRKEVAQDIKLNHNGSAKRYMLSATAKGIPVPSTDVLRQAKSELNKQKSIETKEFKIENDIDVSTDQQNMINNEGL